MAQDITNIISQCKEIYSSASKNDLVWRWDIGNIVSDIYDNKDKYEEKAINKLADALELSPADISRFKKFFNSFKNKDELEKAAGKGYKWSHFKVINDLPDGQIKEDLKNKIKESETAPLLKDIQKEIDDRKQEQLKSSDNGTAGSDSEKKSSSNNPNKPVNAALKACEKLMDDLGSIWIHKKDGLDFDNDNQEKKYNENIQHLAAALVEISELKKKIFDDFEPVDDTDEDMNADADTGADGNNEDESKD